MLNRFTVTGLHGKQNIRADIDKDRLVLVGENGTGKSTFVNLLYYVITRQWRRLAEHRFKAIEAQFGDQVVTITPEHIDGFRNLSLQLRRHHQTFGMRHGHLVDRDILMWVGRPLEFELGLSKAGFPLQFAKRIVADLDVDTHPEWRGLHEVDATIRRAVTSEVLYLPTYRRIEHDLKLIFRSADLEVQLDKWRESIAKDKGAAGYIELVEFGMHDVELTVSSKLNAVKESLRSGLSNLTGTYLRDVIRGLHAKADATTVLAISDERLDATLARLDEATLPSADKSSIKRRVQELRQRGGEASESDGVIVHFLTKLLELQAIQESEEKGLRDFVATCNSYLSNKEMVYDGIAQSLFVWPLDQSERLELKSLSSGEKQIVSLFSHIYLSGGKRFYVIIDEPELSLSVVWQRRFLPDILSSQRCDGLIAVTHSPFIWDNELEPHIRSIAQLADAAS